MSRLSEIEADLGPLEKRVAELQTAKAAVAKEGEAIKGEMDELRRQWDYLDNEGSQSEKQTQLSIWIGKLQEKLKALTGEEY
jgi:chromosome segregation ATPase